MTVPGERTGVCFPYLSIRGDGVVWRAFRVYLSLPLVTDSSSSRVLLVRTTTLETYCRTRGTASTCLSTHVYLPASPRRRYGSPSSLQVVKSSSWRNGPTVTTGDPASATRRTLSLFQRSLDTPFRNVFCETFVLLSPPAGRHSPGRRWLHLLSRHPTFNKVHSLGVCNTWLGVVKTWDLLYIM